jgi:hypothetical protein
MSSEHDLPSLADVRHLPEKSILILLYQHALTQRCGTHERRIASLEKWRTFLFGAWAMVCIGAFCVWDYFVTILGGHGGRLK